MFYELLTLALSIKTMGSRHLSVHGKIDILMEEESPLSLYQEWIHFQQKYNKQYEGKEAEFRFKNFKNNYEFVKNHNLKYNLGQVSFFLTINKFADLNEMEFGLFHKGLKSSPPTNKVAKSFNFNKNLKSDLSSHVDWRTKNVVTPIKNQGSCGSCYAFAAIASLEGQYAFKNNKLVSYSEQNIVDCSHAFGNSGCDGGDLVPVYNYVQNNHGLDTEEEYPYVGHQQKCQYKKNPFTVTGHVNIPKANETALQQAVAMVGPIALEINATIFFQFYGGGIFHDLSCSSESLNHGVVAVGYGVENDTDYWLIKNSWGKGWGEAGYIKMTRNAHNQCGVATNASYPLL